MLSAYQNHFHLLSFLESVVQIEDMDTDGSRYKKLNEEEVEQLALLHYPGWQISDISSGTFTIEVGEGEEAISIFVWFIILAQFLKNEQGVKVKNMSIIERGETLDVIKSTRTNIIYPKPKTFRKYNTAVH